MTRHFPTVPLEVALQKLSDDDARGFLPLVLVVDDESLVVETLRIIFNSNGLAVITAEDGAAALEMARLMPPDVLISDVAMPGMSGLDLAVEVRNALPDCDIILFSGEPSTCDRVVQYHAQGYDFVTLIKPVHPTQLLACVFELLSLRGWVVPDIAPIRSDPDDVIFFSPVSALAKEGARCRGIEKKSGMASGHGSVPQGGNTNG